LVASSYEKEEGQAAEENGGGGGGAGSQSRHTSMQANLFTCALCMLAHCVIPHNCISQQIWSPTVTKSLTNLTSLIVLPGVKSAHGAGKCRAARKALHTSGGRRGGSARRPTLHYPGSWLAAASASVWRPGGGGGSAAQWRGMPGVTEYRRSVPRSPAHPVVGVLVVGGGGVPPPKKARPT